MFVLPFACDHLQTGRIAPDRRAVPVINLSFVCLLVAAFALSVIAVIIRHWAGEGTPWYQFDFSTGVFAPLNWLLHINVFHLTGNLLLLFAFGNVANRHLGHWRYSVFVVVSGIGGLVTHAFFSDLPVVGASAVVFACFGYVLTVAPGLRVRCTYWLVIKWGIAPLPISAVAGLLLGGQGILMMLEVGKTISFPAHGFGLAFGAAVGAVARRRAPGAESSEATSV